MYNDPIEHHKILGLEYPSTKVEIRKAFLRLAHIHHPDKGGDENMFKKINNSYQFLINDGYWEVLAQEKKKRKEKGQSVDPEVWKPKIFCSDDGRSYWTEDRDGFVVSFYGDTGPMEEVIYK